MPVDDPLPLACTGAIFCWELGSPCLTYPFGIHSAISNFSPSYTLEMFNETLSTVTVRSPLCKSRLRSGQSWCERCGGLGPMVEVVQQRSGEAPGSKKTETLSNRQLQQRLDATSKHVNELKLSVSYSKSIHSSA